MPETMPDERSLASTAMAVASAPAVAVLGAATMAAEAVTAAVASAAALGADFVGAATGQASDTADEAKPDSAEGGQEKAEGKSGA